jgi:hypothetical protein
LPSSTFVQALFDTLVPPDGEHPTTIKRLRDAIKNLGLPASNQLQQALTSLLNSAEGDLAKARANVERWFDDTMDRLSGVYRRYVSKCLLGIGLALAIATNADTVQLIERLEQEPTLRAELAEQASKFSADNAQTAQAQAQAQLQAEADAPQPGEPTPPPRMTRALTSDPSAQGAALRAQMTQLERLDILFWDTSGYSHGDDPLHPRALRAFAWKRGWFGWLALKLAGFIMTALAVSLGAPFWFDLLGRLVNLRGTGAKPAKSAASAAA